MKMMCFILGSHYKAARITERDWSKQRCSLGRRYCHWRS